MADTPEGARKRPSIAGAAAFTSAFVFIVLWIKNVDVWNNYFDKNSLIYLPYNVLRIAFIFYMAAALHYVGKRAVSLIIREDDGLRVGAVDRFLLYSYMGASLTTVFMFILGLLKLYYLPVMLAVTVPMVFFSYRGLHAGVGNIPASLGAAWGRLSEGGRLKTVIYSAMTAAAIVQLLYLLILRGLLPGIMLNDAIGHILPYYKEVLQNHHIYMNKYYADFFLIKGAGLNFLAAMLTDVQGVQLITYYMFILSALTVFRFARHVCGRDIGWPIAAVLVYLSSAIIIQGFQKLHISVASFIIYIVYMGVFSFSLNGKALRKWSYIQSLAAAATVVTVFLSFGAVFAILTFQFVLFPIMRRHAKPRFLFAPLIAAAAVFALILMINYFTTGTFALKYFLSDYTNRPLMDKWISQSALLLRYELTSVEGGMNAAESTVDIRRILKADSSIVLLYIAETAVDKAMVPMHNFAYYALFLWTVVYAFRRDEAERPAMMFVFFMFLFVIAMRLLTTGAYTGSESDNSVFRFTMFIVGFKAFLYAASLQYLHKAFVPRRLKGPAAAVLLVTVSVFAAKNFILSARDVPLVLGYKNLAFFSGKLNYADIYGQRNEDFGNVKMCMRAQRAADTDSRILALNFLPSCYGMPGSSFERPFGAVFNKSGDFDDIHFGRPEMAIKTLRSHGIDYFLIDFGRPLYATAYAPIFNPQSLRTHFKTAWRAGSYLLLTWRDADGPAIHPSDMKKYIYLRYADTNTVKAYERAWGKYKMQAAAYK